MTERDALELLRIAGASVEGPTPAARVRGRAMLEAEVRTVPTRRASLALRISAVAAAAVLVVGIAFGLGLSRTRFELAAVRMAPEVAVNFGRVADTSQQIAVIEAQLSRIPPPGEARSERVRLRKLRHELREACARIQSIPEACR